MLNEATLPKLIRKQYLTLMFLLGFGSRLTGANRPGKVNVEILYACYAWHFLGLLGKNICEKRIFRAGFGPVPSWECVYFRPSLRLLMMVYVDDFKFAGDGEPLQSLEASQQ